MMGVGVIFRSRVDSVVGSDDESKFCVGEVVVDLIHLQDNVIRNSSLSKLNIQLSWQQGGYQI